jgi:protein-S-isoprenylcysteine O-methyltransferase
LHDIFTGTDIDFEANRAVMSAEDVTHETRISPSIFDPNASSGQDHNRLEHDSHDKAYIPFSPEARARPTVSASTTNDASASILASALAASALIPDLAPSQDPSTTTGSLLSSTRERWRNGGVRPSTTAAASTNPRFNADSLSSSVDMSTSFSPSSSQSTVRDPDWLRPVSHVWENPPHKNYAIQLLPSGKRSLARISQRGFVLGIVFGTSLTLSIISILLLYVLSSNKGLLYTGWTGFAHDLLLSVSPSLSPQKALAQISVVLASFWPLALFFALLSNFHFLEFYITARYNPLKAKVNSYLISWQDREYNAANLAAVSEALIRGFLAFRKASSSASLKSAAYSVSKRDQLELEATVSSVRFMVGLFLVILGQTTRSLAMIHAGKSFNHQVQSVKASNHVLITTGIYRYLRHPSYFGFFYWAIGSQIMLGNWVCLALYLVVVWRFFSKRIEREEKYLLKFFGDEYKAYRQSTKIWIPFL